MDTWNLSRDFRTVASRGMKVDRETMNPGSRGLRTPGAEQQGIFRPYLLQARRPQCNTWPSFSLNRALSSLIMDAKLGLELAGADTGLHAFILTFSSIPSP